jgi:16S rRNA (guanine966-N2)-methyltransferase
LRIISGNLRGRRLFSVPGFETRPTSDRIRESIFNILPANFNDTRVLDLFAGTGALALEALSRGAIRAWMIDRSKAAIKVIQHNVQVCGLQARTTIVSWDILKNLHCLHTADLRFNLVFMDPPYGGGAVEPTLRNLLQSSALDRQARLVIEHSAHDPLPELSTEFSLTDQRRYGKTLVSFLDCMV